MALPSLRDCSPPRRRRAGGLHRLIHSVARRFAAHLRRPDFSNEGGSLPTSRISCKSEGPQLAVAFRRQPAGPPPGPELCRDVANSPLSILEESKIKKQKAQAAPDNSRRDTIRSRSRIA